MMTKLRVWWQAMQESFWFVPLLINAAGIALALGLIEADATMSKQWMAHWPRLFGVSADGARVILSTIAGSMMTVVGITFSMTLVTLALASSQYSSRILRTFMRDRVTQVVLGMFTGTFTYCLVVLRTIRGDDEGGFVPNVAVLFGVVLAIGGVGVLIFFIHHIASAIQASSILASVAEDTIEAVDRLFPAALGHRPADNEEDPVAFALPERTWQAIPAGGNGYIQSVDNAALLRWAQEQKTIVRMERGIGEFVVGDALLASVARENPPEEDMLVALQAAYTISRHRTLQQDAAFGIRQIVDMALRALSPGINDTTTAVMCVDYLTAILARLASRTIPSSRRFDEGELRVLAIGPTFASLVAESFEQIRGSATGNVAILLRMLGALHTIGSLTADPNRRCTLREQVQWITEVAERTLESSHDRARFEHHLARVRAALESEPVLSTPEHRQEVNDEHQCKGFPCDSGYNG